MRETEQVRLLSGAEVRTADEGKEKGFTGRLVPYDVFAVINGMFEEAMSRSVFAKSIIEAAGNLPLLARHDAGSWPIGRSVEWDDRQDGLWGRWVMADTEQAREAHQLIDQGYVRGLSCGFQPFQSDWDLDRRPPDLPRVVRRQARLLEASVVPCPTWTEAVITVTRATNPGTPHRDRYAEWLESIR